MVVAGTVGKDHALIQRLRALTFGPLTPFYFTRAGPLEPFHTLQTDSNKAVSVNCGDAARPSG
jgi:hypothetical protein